MGKKLIKLAENSLGPVFIHHLFIFITNLCDSRCITCNFWKNRKEKELIPEQKILDAIRILTKHHLEAITFTGGEPLLRASRLFNLCKKIKSNFPSVQLILDTNGVHLHNYLKEAINHFDVLVISLDSSKEDIYTKIRGIDAFKVVTKNIKNIRKLDKEIQIVIRCVVQRDNYKEIPNIIRLAKNLRVNTVSFLPLDVFSTHAFGRENKTSKVGKLSLNMHQTNEFKNIVDSILKDKAKNSLLIKEGKELIDIYKYYLVLNKKKSFVQPKCNVFWSSSFIDYNGNVFPCFFSKPIGNLKDRSYEEILNSQTMKSLRKKKRQGKLQLCKWCVCPLFYS